MLKTINDCPYLDFNNFPFVDCCHFYVQENTAYGLNEDRHGILKAFIEYVPITITFDNIHYEKLLFTCA